MYSLTNDPLVSTDDGPSSIQGCQVFQLNVFPSDQGRPLSGPILQVKTFSKIFNCIKLKLSDRAEVAIGGMKENYLVLMS